MGEVWRARDSKLGREVAIKTLPEEFAQDGERLARFEREAKLLASLNHPNIATIHGLEEDHGTRFLVLELVEGDTLADRLKSGAIPVEESLKLALQIAEALEAAHEKGVIHRDLKPLNIKVTPEGKVKVLDFGLAKAFTEDGSDLNLSNSPTLSMTATQQGVILGTAAYMSPEQAKGRTVDKRTDVWAFGCVLYELLTGKLAFQAADVSETLAAILMKEPDWEAIASAPPAVANTIQRCLQKNQKQRIRDVGDVRLALGGAFSPPVVDETAPTVPGNLRKERMVWALALLLLVVAVVGQQFTGPSEPTAQPTRLSVVPDTKSMRFGFALSPDGRRFVYGGVPLDGGARTPQLWIQGLDQEVPRLLAGTEGALYPFWAPDGESIGFFAGGLLKRVPASGGAVQTITETPPRPSGGSWSQDDVIIFAGGGAIYEVSADGGEALVRRVPDSSIGEAALRWPSFLPDGRRFLVSVRNTEGSSSLALASLDSDMPAEVLAGPTNVTSRGEYVESGYLFYRDRSRVLVAQAVDAETIQPVGAPVPVSSGPVWNPGGWGAFSARTEILLFQRIDQQDEIGRALIWLDRETATTELLGEPEAFTKVSLSRDGQRAAATVGTDVWLYSADTAPTLLISHPSVDTEPVWSPDGQRFAFSSLRRGVFEVYVEEVGGAGEGLLTVPSSNGNDVFVEDWSRDGQLLVLRRADTLSYDVWIHSLVDGETYPVLQSRFDEFHAQLSPDGNWLAYTSDEAGQHDVYVTAFPERGIPVRISPDGGVQPVWRSDGEELFYLAPDSSIMSVGVTRGNEFVRTPPTRLFFTDAASNGSDRSGFSYDVSPDGQRFLVISGGQRPAVSVLLNWTSVLGPDLEVWFWQRRTAPSSGCQWLFAG